MIKEIEIFQKIDAEIAKLGSIKIFCEKHELKYNIGCLLAKRRKFPNFDLFNYLHNNKSCVLSWTLQKDIYKNNKKTIAL